MSDRFYTVTFDDRAADRRPVDAYVRLYWRRLAHAVLAELYYQLMKEMSDRFADATVTLRDFKPAFERVYVRDEPARTATRLPAPHKFTEDPRIRACKPARGAVRLFHRRHGKDNRT